MIEILITIVFSLLSGIIIGLLPGLPIWLGIFLIFPFIDNLTALQILTYWLGIAIGSQFFGSVSTLLLRIPGENSSLIYLKDTFNLSTQERFDLVRQTAWGSAIATFIALIFVMILYSIGADESIISWTSAYIKFIVYNLLFVLLLWTSEKKSWAAFLLILGVTIAEKTNAALPEWFLKLNYEITNVTVFSATLALIIIPELLNFKKSELFKDHTKVSYSNEAIKWKPISYGSFIGCISGLIPGMTATIGSISAYKLFKGSVSDKIISSESANNSAIITALLPFIVIGIPTTIDSIMVSNALTLKLLEIPSIFREESLFGVSLGWALIMISLVFSIAFFFLSQHFLRYYVKLIELAHSKLLFFYCAIICFLIYFDVSSSTINITSYLLILAPLTVFGVWLKKKDINPLPFLLGLLLGDSIVWTYYHMITIYL
jgi:putative tricarboxylic transport membrane protein